MKRIAWLCLFLAFGLTACGTSLRVPWQNNSEPPANLAEDDGSTAPPVVPEQGLQLSMDQRFSDLPLPVDLKEDLDKSFVYESSSLQIGRMVYITRASVNELSSFYIRECPTAGWELTSVVQADESELKFTKPGKRLSVKIRSLSIGRGGRQLTLTLLPDGA